MTSDSHYRQNAALFVRALLPWMTTARNVETGFFAPVVRAVKARARGLIETVSSSFELVAQSLCPHN